jgi:outer membrane scaffolding protein for murein synthesis (MipA/OmpV family)
MMSFFHDMTQSWTKPTAGAGRRIAHFPRSWVGAWCLSLAFGACAADEPPAGGDHLVLGPGFYSEPSYPGARRTRELLLPFVDAEYADRLYTSATDLLGVYAFKSAGTQLGAALEYDLTERRARDDARFHDLRDIKETARLKWFATKTVSFVTGDANVATDVTGGHQGTLAQSNIWFSTPLVPKSLISVGPGMTWADARYMRTFFTITPAQAAVSPLPVYTAQAGVVDVHWNGLATYEISSRWSIGASDYLGRLHGDARHSPVTLRRAQQTAFAWLAYKIGSID